MFTRFSVSATTLPFPTFSQRRKVYALIKSRNLKVSPKIPSVHLLPTSKFPLALLLRDPRATGKSLYRV
jgi:hypothetical protein